MVIEQIRVSSEIDAYCTKCRMVTNHRVVAIVDDMVKRVICLTCDGQHNFRPPPGQKKPVAKTKRVQKGKKMTRTKEIAPTFTQWIELKESLSVEPRPYVMAETYAPGEAIEHSKFGLGFVTKLAAQNKIEVMFDNTIKTLIMNHK